MAAEYKRILILCKTYPSPSSKHVETSCVAGMEESGRLIRLFPVPFRLITDSQQFKKWQWIRARVTKASDDHRVESYRISVDTIETQGPPLDTKDGWAERKQAISSVEVFDDFEALEHARQSRGITLGLLRPTRLASLQISKAKASEWTADEIAKLMQAQNQGSLFDELTEQRFLKTLKKLPVDFHYHYECGDHQPVQSYKHKLADWEAGALYWNICRHQGWEAKFQQKYFTELAGKDLLFLMGTIHRFPDQWLIVSVIYPPRPSPARLDQGMLF